LPDRNEVVTFAVAAAATNGKVTIKNIRSQDLTSFLSKMDAMGVPYEVAKDSLRVWLDPETELSSVKVETAPHPGFMTDWQQPFSILLTQANGTSIIHETVYPNRLDYLFELGKMGADFEVLTPSEAGLIFKPEKYGFDWGKRVADSEPKVVAEITGPTKLVDAEVQIPDLRAGATLVIAALAAEGKSKVHGISHIDRGYENFEEKLQELGAQIRRVEDI